MIRHILRSSENTYCTLGLSCGEVMWNMHLANTAACSSPSVLLMVELVVMHINSHYIIFWLAIQTVMRFDNFSSLSVRQEV
jgi:hypothetical protein